MVALPRSPQRLVGHDRVSGEHASNAHLLGSIKANLRPRFVVALLPGDKAAGIIRAH
jgi:hypothetical protein